MMIKKREKRGLLGGFALVATAAVAFGSLAVAPVAVATSPANADDACIPETVGTLEWAFKDSWNSYMTSSGWVVTPHDGAQRDTATGVITYQQDRENSTFDPTTGMGVIAFTGGTRHQGHHGAADLVLQNPQITVNGDGTGTLSLESSKEATSNVDVQRLDFVNLTGLTPTDTEEYTEFSGVQGTFATGIGPSMLSMYTGQASSPLTFKAGKAVTCPTVSVVPSAVSIGDEVTVTGSGFVAGESVNFTLEGTDIGTENAGSDGSVTLTFTVSADHANGDLIAAGAKAAKAKFVINVAPSAAPSAPGSNTAPGGASSVPAAGGPAVDPGAGVSVGDPSVDDSADDVDDVPGGSVDSSDATHTPGTDAPTPGATPVPGTDVDTSDVDAPNAGVVTPGTGSVDTTTPGGVESDEADTDTDTDTDTDAGVDTAPTAVVAEGLESSAGEEFTLTGRNFVPNSEVVIEFHSTPVRLGVVMTDADGVFSFTGRVPSGAAVGDHNIVLRQGDREVRIPYVVKQSVPVKVEATDHDHDHAGEHAGHGYGYGQADAGEHAGHDHGLAVTGAGAGQFAAVGVALLVLAAGLLVVSRRRV